MNQSGEMWGQWQDDAHGTVESGEVSKVERILPGARGVGWYTGALLPVRGKQTTNCVLDGNVSIVAASMKLNVEAPRASFVPVSYRDQLQWVRGTGEPCLN